MLMNDLLKENDDVTGYDLETTLVDIIYFLEQSNDDDKNVISFKKIRKLLKNMGYDIDNKEFSSIMDTVPALQNLIQDFDGEDKITLKTNDIEAIDDPFANGLEMEDEEIPMGDENDPNMEMMPPNDPTMEPDQHDPSLEQDQPAVPIPSNEPESERMPDDYEAYDEHVDNMAKRAAARRNN